MQIAVVTFDGFNEIDSTVAAHIPNRMSPVGWTAQITAPTGMVTSMNGLRIEAQRPLEFAAEADAVIIGSGRRTREMVEDQPLLSRLQLDPRRQLIASQCSGALFLIRLGLLGNVPVCTDIRTRPDVEAAGFTVLDSPFHAHGNVATAGGCLSGSYLAAWMLWRSAGWSAVAEALSYVMPRGEEDEYFARIRAVVGPFIPNDSLVAK